METCIIELNYENLITISAILFEFTRMYYRNWNTNQIKDVLDCMCHRHLHLKDGFKIYVATIEIWAVRKKHRGPCSIFSLLWKKRGYVEITTLNQEVSYIYM